MRIRVGEVTLQCVLGNIVEQADVDAVVNAANADLVPGGGVDGAIHAAAGPGLADAARQLAPLAPGGAVITAAFGLPNLAVVHCLGPVYGLDDPAPDLLAACHIHALDLAEERGMTSIAFPAISTGAFGYPLPEAAEIATRTVARCAPMLRSVRTIRFVLWSNAAYDAFRTALVRAAAIASQELRESASARREAG